MYAQTTNQHSQSVSITEYAAALAKHGVSVLPGTEGAVWVRHDIGAMMRVPKFKLDPPTPGELRKASWSRRVAAGSYLLEPDKHHPANACLYICTDRAYTLDKLPSAMRRNVRRGSKALRIAPITPDELLAHGPKAFYDTRQRVGLADGTPKEFHQRFSWRARCQGHIFLGAWRDDQLAAFLSLTEVEDWVEIESCYSTNALLKLRPNDTLMYHVLTHYLHDRQFRVVCYGLSSIQAENNADGLHTFKLKVGFEAQPVHRVFVLHPLLRPLANRLTLRSLNAALRVWPRGRVLKKAEGMLAYLLGETRIPQVEQQGVS